MALSSSSSPQLASKADTRIASKQATAASSTPYKNALVGRASQVSNDLSHVIPHTLATTRTALGRPGKAPQRYGKRSSLDTAPATALVPPVPTPSAQSSLSPMATMAPSSTLTAPSTPQGRSSSTSTYRQRLHDIIESLSTEVPSSSSPAPVVSSQASPSPDVSSTDAPSQVPPVVPLAVSPPQAVPSAEPASLVDDFDKLDFLHRLHGHCGSTRLASLVRAMHIDDPDRPNPRHVHLWTKYRKCSTCAIANMERPSQKDTHPPTTLRALSSPGTDISIDGLGAFSEPDCDGNVDGWVFTDLSSNYIHVFPVKSRTLEHLVTATQLWIAQTGVTPRSIRSDGEMIKGSFADFCRDKGIKLTACAPHVHQGNAGAENAVRKLKYAARASALDAATSHHLHSYCLQHACTASNRTSSTTDITGQRRSPCTMWPQAPFNHNFQKIHPFGCQAVGFLGKRSADPNNAPRGRPGIYLGHALLTNGHRVYHFDSDSVLTYGYVEVFPNKFPCKERQMAGEARVTLTDGSWRACYDKRLGEVSDFELAEFATGKQLQVVIPQSVYKTYPGTWSATVHRSVTHTNKVVSVRLLFSAYNGAPADLSDDDRLLLNGKVLKYIELPVSATPLKLRCNTTTNWHLDLRTLLDESFPGTTALWQLAEHNMRLRQSYPQSSAVDYEPVPLTTDSSDVATALALRPKPRRQLPVKRAPALGNRIVIPVRTVGGSRIAQSTWMPASTRKPMHRATKARTVSQVIRSRAMPQQIIRVRATTAAASLDGVDRFEPRTIAEAQSHESWPRWKAAMEKEVNGLLGRNVWTAVPRSSVPADVTIMGSQFVFKDKVNGAKARLVVRGDQQRPKPLPEDTYASTPSATEVRMLVSIATQLNRPIHTCDMIQAFTQSHELRDGEELYIYPPYGYETDRSVVWRLNKPLYGLAIAPRRWADTFKEWLKSYGFKPVNCSDTFQMWTNPVDAEDTIHLVFHVDDVLFSFGSDDTGQDFKTALLSRFDGTDDGPVRTFVGVDFHRDEYHTYISQEALVTQLLEAHGLLACNSVATPMEPHTLLTAQTDADPQGPVDVHAYQQIVGTLLYLTTWTRPDISFATNQLAKFMSNPSVKHMSSAYRVLRYLKGTKALGIQYTRSSLDPNRLIAFADADWAACKETRRSVNGYLCLLNGGAISWKSRQQKAVASSTSEAEYVSASKAADDVVYLRRIMEDLSLAQVGPTPLYEDNRGCRMMSENPVSNDRSKHIDYRVHSLRERVADGTVRLVDCPTFDMAADPFTKNLAAPDFSRHRSVQLGHKRHTAPPPPADLTKAGPRTCTARVQPPPTRRS